MTRNRFPNTNLGWHRYYAKRYEKNGSEAAAYLADLHFLFYLAFGNDRIPA